MAEKSAPRRRRWSALLTAGVVVTGSLIGVGAFTMVYADGASYLGNNPRTCTNCHIMNEQYDGWLVGSHRNVATCNDCHLPHDNVASKYLVKMENGFSHGSRFTTGNYPENIRIRPSSLRITNAACLHCHGGLTDDMRESAHVNNENQVSCVHCHSGVGH